MGRIRRCRNRGTPLVSGALGEPPPLLVAENDDVLTRLQDEIEVASPYRSLCPPAVDDPPLLSDQRDGNPPHFGRHAPVGCDERVPRLVQSSRGTSMARLSGTRDHGATSTIEQTASRPAAALT
jgi:hypothetical protein